MFVVKVHLHTVCISGVDRLMPENYVVDWWLWWCWDNEWDWTNWKMWKTNQLSFSSKIQCTQNKIKIAIQLIKEGKNRRIIEKKRKFAQNRFSVCAVACLLSVGMNNRWMEGKENLNLRETREQKEQDRCRYCTKKFRAYVHCFSLAISH